MLFLAKNPLLANSVSPLPHCAASQLIRLLRQNKKYKNLYKALARQSSTLAHLHCYVACVSLSVGSKVFETGLSDVMLRLGHQRYLGLKHGSVLYAFWVLCTSPFVVCFTSATSARSAIVISQSFLPFFLATSTCSNVSLIKPPVPSYPSVFFY